MAGEWATAALGELCEFRAGSVFKPALQGQSSGRYPFVKVSDMNLPANMVWIQDANNWVSEEDLRELRARPFPAGTVVFAKIGEALRQNRLRQVICETIVDNNMMGAAPRPERVDPRFFYYALSRFDFSDIAQGTALPYLTVSALSNLTIDLPSLPEQRAIAHILGTLDDKIELNRRMNETLEAIARAVFKSWFVDFLPVRAKMAARTQTGDPVRLPAATAAQAGAMAESRDPGLPKPLADLFPDSFEDSDLGEIPKGWRVGRVGDLAGLLGGYAFKSRDWIDRGVPVVKIGSVKPGIVDLNEVSFVSEEIAEEAKRFRLSIGDLLVGMTGYVGEVGMVPLTDNPPLLNQRVGKFVLEKNGTSALAFLCCLSRRTEFKMEVEAKSHGTAQANVSAEGILSISVVLPPKVLRDEFNRLGKSDLDRLLANHAESRILAALRDALLPKFISGELRIPDAERIVGRQV